MASTAPPRHVRQKPMNQNRPPQILERHTKGGRRLRYELRVIQQPERARACGSGAKSSADRRPVDPPPVVELKIFEVVGLDPREDPDITFAYNANFFLFATLEMARPIAHGRVAPPAPAQVPVLTGMPVSGMAYLDRPSEAGYFIFPDLSVRHEGKYRLSFNLYEETKKPEEDADQEPPVEGKLPAGQEPEACFDWRMEIKSDAFDVFSAKKFPGLAESTSLSRLVAEQGCRVRIRRDVRMRRRGEKGSEDFEEEVYERQARAPVSDELHRERSRSLSTGSDGERRQPYEQPPSHLGFMGGRQYPQPQFAAPPPAVPAARFPASGYGPQPNYGQAAPPPPQAPHLGYERQFPPSAYPSNPPRELLHEDDSWRRASAAGHPHEQHPHRQYAIEHSFNHHPHPFPYASRSPAPGDLPPLQLHHLSGKPDGSSAAPLPSVRSFAPVLHSPTYERREERSDLYAPAPKGASLAAAPPAPEAPAPRNGKRSFDTTFSASAEPLYNGMRPSTPHDQDAVEDDDDRLPTVAEMHYKRADGTHQIRPPVAVV